MKKFVVCLTLLFSCFVLVGNAMVAGFEDECIAKCKEAAQLVKDKGIDAGVTEISKKDGKFVSADTFVILFNFEGVVLAHPTKPDTIGKNRMKDKDSKGKAYYQEYVEVAKTKGAGWVEHMWVSPEKKEFQKKTYVQRVEGQDMAVCAGYIIK